MVMLVACIPAKDEEKTIAGVVLRTSRYADDILVCDDGSRDLTGKIAEKMGVRVLRHERSMGYGVALRTLFENALELGGNYVVLLDADGQHNPDDIPRLVQPLKEGKADMVIGSRFIGGRKNIPMFRRFGIRAITEFSRATSRTMVSDSQSGFRAFKAGVLKDLMPAEQGMGASVEILVKAVDKKLRVIEVPVDVSYKGLEPSTYNPIYHGFDVITSILKFASLRHPLIFYGIPGLGMILFGLGYGYFTIQSYAAQAKPITNVALLSMAFVTLGAVLVFMAVILFTLTNLVKESGYRKT